MRKKLFIAVFVIASVLLVGCNPKEYDIDYECSQDYEGAHLQILNWGEYIDRGLLNEFEKRCNVKITNTEADSNEIMYTQITNGDTDFDIIVPSDYMIERLIAEDLLYKINFDHVPNYEHIEAELKGQDFDPNNEYSIPYFWGTFGIMYNKRKLEELGIQESEVNSWEILKDERLKGNLLLYDSQRDMFLIGFKLLDSNLSLNVVDGDEEAYANNIEQAKEALRPVHQNAAQYGTDNIKFMIANGDYAVAVVYSGDYLEVYYELEGEADDVGYVIPKEGSNIWFDSFVISKRSQNKRLAEEFLNFMADPKVAYYNAIYVGYSTANAGAYELLKEDDEYKEVVELEAYRPDIKTLEKL